MASNALLQPIQLGSIHLRNRIFMSSLTRNRSVPTNVPNEVNVEYYRQRARGGAGLIFSEGTLVCQQGTEWENAPGIWNDNQVEGWKKVTDAVHEEGGAIFCQLWHVGRIAHPDAREQKESGRPVYAPSAISARGGKFKFLEGAPGYVTPTEIQDPWIIVEYFKNAAMNAKKAGFDGVDLHAAGGFIIHQFLDTSSNHRSDEWGGSAENRAKLGIEALKVLIGVFGEGRVGMKLSPGGGYNDMGMELEETKETFGYFIKEANKLKIAYVILVRYDIDSAPSFDGVKRGTPHSMNTYKPLFTHSSLILNGGLTLAEGEALVQAGEADAAMFGALWICNPDLGKRVEEGKEVRMDVVDWASVYGRRIRWEGGWEEVRKEYTDYPNAE